MSLHPLLQKVVDMGGSSPFNTLGDRGESISGELTTAKVAALHPKQLCFEALIVLACGQFPSTVPGWKQRQPIWGEEGNPRPPEITWAISNAAFAELEWRRTTPLKEINQVRANWGQNN